MSIDILNNLPIEILDIIFNYLKPANLIFLNKYYYEKYNFLIEKIFFKGKIQKYHSYIRNIVREDAIFIFKYCVKKNFNNWLLNTNFKYKNIIYINYINYLIELATIYKSNKCCELLKYNLLLRGLLKISLKNNKVKYNKWIN